MAAILKYKITGDLLAHYETEEELASLSVTTIADKKRMALFVRGIAANTKATPSFPANEHELIALRELNRKGFTQDILLLMGNARYATWHFNSNAQKGISNALQIFDQHPKSAQFSWLSWLLFPEWMVIQHWYGFFDTDPLLASLLIFSSFLSGLIGWTVLLGGGLGVYVFFQFFLFLYSMGGYFMNWLLWPILPRCVFSAPPPHAPPSTHAHAHF